MNLPPRSAYSQIKMDFLWSPWRYAYVSSTTDSKRCVFCIGQLPDGDTERLVLFRAQFNFVIMNLYPYSTGHLMVVPYSHVGKLSDADSEQVTEMMALSRTAVRILEEVYRPDGFNLGMNIGECAGAGVRDHLHLHVVPRWCSDVNFMTVTGETRVLPEELVVSHQKLRPLFEREVKT